MNKSLLILLLVLLAAGGYWLLAEPPALTVEAAVVERGRVDATVANTRAGTVTACQRSKLSLPIGGQIFKLHVSEGSRVEAGQLMMELWNKDAKAQVSAAQAGDLSAAQDKNSRCIAAEADTREARRQQEIFNKQLTSDEIVDRARSRAQASQAACAAAESRHHQATAQLAVARAVLDKTYLLAPFNGTVAEITGEVGEFTTPSPPGVATPPAIDLLTADCHYVVAPIDEVDAGKLRVGLPVTVTLDAFRDSPLEGRLRRIAPYVQDYAKQARTVEVEVELDAPADTRLLAGYSADVEIILDRASDTLRLPTDALTEDHQVWLLGDDNRLEKRQVTPGLQNWQYTQISEGLAQGDTVVIAAGRKDLVAGARVSVR